MTEPTDQIIREINATLEKTAGPAYPTDFATPWGDIHCPGMTLRDHFAGLAMQGMLANGRRIEGVDAIQKRAMMAYIMADAMIKERKK